MNDFLQIVQSNLSKAQIASEKRKEVAAVLSEASAAIKFATGGRVSIEKLEAINGFTDGFLKSLAYFMQNSKKTTVLVLRHLGHPSVKDIQIAVWNEEATGYPCTVAFAGTAHRCTNKVALKNTLKDLLSNPEIGIAIDKLRNTPIPVVHTPLSSPAAKGIKTVGTSSSAVVKGSSAARGISVTGKTVGKKAEESVVKGSPAARGISVTGKTVGKKAEESVVKGSPAARGISVTGKTVGKKAEESVAAVAGIKVLPAKLKLGPKKTTSAAKMAGKPRATKT